MFALTPIQIRDLTARPRECDSQRVDVWLLSVKTDAAELKIYEEVLGDDEKARAGRFLFAADRARSITARGGLRWLLSSYCQIQPEALTFHACDHGKPALLKPPRDVEFNVSHSGDYVLIGIGVDAQCGVDIERSQVHLSEQEIAEHFFCTREVEWLRRTEDGFLRLWTTKEAVIKAVGRGLSIPLSDVDVTDVVEGRNPVVTLALGPTRQMLWVTELNVIPDYRAAVAIIGGPRELHLLP